MKSNASSLKDAINHLMETYGLSDKLRETRLINSWETLMGKSIANHTKGIYIKNKKLYLELDSAALREELSYSKEKLLQILNEEAGAEILKDVIFR